MSQKAPAGDPEDAPPCTSERDEQLARLIHDDVLQSLAASALSADLCARHCREGNRERALSELEVMRESLDAAVASLRQLLGALRPDN